MNHNLALCNTSPLVLPTPDELISGGWTPKKGDELGQIPENAQAQECKI